MKKMLRYITVLSILMILAFVLQDLKFKGSKMVPSNIKKLCPSLQDTRNSSIKPSSILKEFANNKSDFQRLLLHGGEYRPADCTSRDTVAIIVAYRDREEHLKTFIRYMHVFLQRQKLHYMIFIVELTQSTTFNRGLLLNIGFAEAAKLLNFTCYIFHDVDLLPTNENNFYRCTNTIRHLCTANSKFNYRLPYGGYHGGIMAFPGYLFRKANGYSNLFFGWGGEDDDLASRVKWANLSITRLSYAVGRYEALSHGKDKGNPQNPHRFDLVKKGRERWKNDGLSNLHYNLIQKEGKKMYTWVFVEVNRAELEEINHAK